MSERKDSLNNVLMEIDRFTLGRGDALVLERLFHVFIKILLKQDLARTQGIG